MHEHDPSLFKSYVQLARSLSPTIDGVCLLGPKLQVLGATRRMPTHETARWLQAEKSKLEGSECCFCSGGTSWVDVLIVEESDNRFLGAFCVSQTLESPPTQPTKHAQQARSVLKPLLDCIHRDLSAAYPKGSRLKTMTERSEELEWLFKLTSQLHESTDDGRLLEKLVGAAASRLGAGLAAVFVPAKRFSVENLLDAENGAVLRQAWERAKQPVCAFVQRQHRPLLVNRPPKDRPGHVGCKVLAVPIVRDNGFVIGVLGFLKPRAAADFSDSQLYLARHLGRQAGQLVERQYDLMTGLYTRAGLEEACASLLSPMAENSLIYFDVDHMHVVNELRGFEIGNEVLIRIADLLAPPLLPSGALASRIESDQFAVFMPSCSVDEAKRVAEAILEAAASMAVGPADNLVELSLSGGVAPLMDAVSPFQRALAAAELACKTAKNRGRRRIETYAFEDFSMMRRHVDVVSVGRLREAFKSNRFVLFGQPIVSLRPNDSYRAYEVLLRCREDDGSYTSIGELVNAAARYQLLPSIDKWVTQHVLEILTPYRRMLETSQIGISINVSGPSISAESFVTQFAKQLSEARLPPGCVTIELTEQAAVNNVARANNLILRLKALGCRFALDDFGTGANSLTTLKSLSISRLKIDGSFIRNLTEDRNSQSTVRAIVELARGLSMDTVAEYVETKAIADLARKLGVDYAQGHAFGKAGPLAAILQTLNDDESRRLHRLYLES